VRTSPYRWLVPLAWVVAAAGACSSSSSPPPELGDCTKIGDASCGGPLTGGGGGPGGDSGASDGANGADTSTSCGAAENALGTQNTTCVPCIESTNCCTSGSVCSAQGGVGGCLALVQCMIGCGTNTTCQETCSSTASANATTAYDDFSGCLASQCPGCPVLPPPNTGDF
jgi:hypothetical protein